MIVFDAQLVAAIVVCVLGLSILLGTYGCFLYLRITRPPPIDTEMFIMTSPDTTAQTQQPSVPSGIPLKPISSQASSRPVPHP
jgi:hypothetical protein